MTKAPLATGWTDGSRKRHSRPGNPNSKSGSPAHRKAVSLRAPLLRISSRRSPKTIRQERRGGSGIALTLYRQPFAAREQFGLSGSLRPRVRRRWAHLAGELHEGGSRRNYGGHHSSLLSTFRASAIACGASRSQSYRPSSPDRSASGTRIKRKARPTPLHRSIGTSPQDLGVRAIHRRLCARRGPELTI